MNFWVLFYKKKSAKHGQSSVERRLGISKEHLVENLQEELGFDNYHKIVVRYHICVPKFWPT